MNEVAITSLKERTVNLSNRLTIDVAVTSEVVKLQVADGRPETISLFGKLSAEHSQQFATDAWTVGLRALANAHAQAQEARLQDVGKALVEDIDHQLARHVSDQQRIIATELGKFFDPKDGQVTQRLAAFVDDQGVLAHLLGKYLAPQNSILAETLARQVGESSPLFKKLSPTDSEGLVKVLEAQLSRVMNDGHTELVRALDPLSEDSAVARFLKSLRDDLKRADEDRKTQLSVALGALDANDPNSLINRLVRETTSAREAVLHAVNPDVPESPMAIMKQALTELLRGQSESQKRFEDDVREAIARLESKRAQDQKSPRGGFDFEDAVVTFITGAICGGPLVVEATGNTTGLFSRSKKGDLVIRFTEESAFDGAGTVFEAKRDASYTVSKALEELDAARANRNAGAGVFVMAKSSAPVGFPQFARHGSNVLVIWDETDPVTNAYLHAAVLLGLSLATRGKRGDQGDIEALSDVQGRIEEELRRIEKIEKLNGAIRKNSDDIVEELRKARKQFDLLLRKAKNTLTALNIELNEEEAERTTPIALPTGSLIHAVSAVDATDKVASDCVEIG
jgi:hypothetical protein